MLDGPTADILVEKEKVRAVVRLRETGETQTWVGEAQSSVDSADGKSGRRGLRKVHEILKPLLLRGVKVGDGKKVSYGGARLKCPGYKV